MSFNKMLCTWARNNSCIHPGFTGLSKHVTPSRRDCEKEKFPLLERA